MLNASDQLYIKELALYTAIGLVADLLSGCEIQVFRQGQPVHDGNWFRLNIRPNENQSGAEFKAQIVQKLYYDGQALIVPLAGKLYVASSFQREEYPILGDKFLNIYLENLQLQKQFRAGDVYFLTQGDRSVRRLVDGVFMGYADLLAASSDAVKAGAGEKYALQVGRLPSGTPEEQQKYMSKLQENLQAFVKAESAAYPLTKEQTLTRFSGGTSASTSSVTDLRKDVYAVVASALHLPESLLSGNITSVEQVTNQALTFAIDPLAQKLSSEITAKTWTGEEILYQGCWANVDTSSIGHVDLVSMAEKLDKLISSGICCIDEVRRRCNLPELNTDWSERHYLTKNYDTVENTMDPLEGGENNA
ncbi:MAG: phage portal protein [Clostridiales bacterium]|nr:phage portal protein [Clostridiales bacterium]